MELGMENKEPSALKRCGSCRYWFYDMETNSQTLGRCKRNPPITTDGYHPLIGKINWCGKWKGISNEHKKRI